MVGQNSTPIDKYGILYEITVKTIDEKCLDDCADNLEKLGRSCSNIIIICNLPKDIETLDLKENYLNYRGIGFQFLDIKEFVKTSYCLLTEPQREKIIQNLGAFVSDPNRKIPTYRHGSMSQQMMSQTAHTKK